MSDLNFNENTINKLKDMMNKGELNDVISQIPPEMIQNFSSMMQNSDASSQKSNQNETPNYNSNINSEARQNSNNQSSFDFSSIDMNTILKMKSVMEKMNSKNDPRANLLYSLKPYLRDTKKDKLDQYVNLLNVSKIADIMNKNNNENKQ